MAKGAQEIAREAAARAVVPGAPKQDWNNWVPKTNKPRVQQLVSEIISRSANLEQNKRPKPSAWTGQKCLEWLQTHGLDVRLQQRQKPHEGIKCHAKHAPEHRA